MHTDGYQQLRGARIAFTVVVILLLVSLLSQKLRIDRLEQSIAPRATQSVSGEYYGVIGDSDQLTSIPIVTTNQAAATSYVEAYKQHHNYRVVKVVLIE